MNNYEQNILLFRKIIASLSCIEKTTSVILIKQKSIDYLNDLIPQYENYRDSKNINEIEFKYSEKEIIDFSNECYGEVDIFTFAEDVEFGFTELVNNILSERKKNNE